MAFYRQIQCVFWRDAFVQSLTPEEKYFYFYVLTNENTKQTGIYQITKRQISWDTGYNDETVSKLLARFIGFKKILYDEETKELMVLNWVKHNWSNSPKVLKCLEKELKEIKSPDFVSLYKDTVYKLYGYCIDSLLIDLPKNKNNNKNNNNNNNKNNNNDFSGENDLNFPIDKAVPDLDKQVLIKPLFELWAASYIKIRNNDYDSTDFNLEYSAIDALLNIYYHKPHNAGKFKETVIEDFKHIFEGALTIPDRYYFTKMTLPFLSKNFTEVKTMILQRMESNANGQTINRKQSDIINTILENPVQ